MITDDGGGSNGSKRRLWKTELQRLVDEIGLPVKICHYPTGTRKWNKIEHRLFNRSDRTLIGEAFRWISVENCMLPNLQTDSTGHSITA